MPKKSSSAGRRSGANPKQRIPSLLNDVASGPPDRQYGTTLADGSASRSAAVMAAHSVPSKSVSTATSWWMNSRLTPGPSKASISASSSSPYPGTKRQSTSAVASPGMDRKSVVEGQSGAAG